MALDLLHKAPFNLLYKKIYSGHPSEGRRKARRTNSSQAYLSLFDFGCDFLGKFWALG